jgi:hypothetical protein
VYAEERVGSRPTHKVVLHKRLDLAHGEVVAQRGERLECRVETPVRGLIHECLAIREDARELRVLEQLRRVSFRVRHVRLVDWVLGLTTLGQKVSFMPPLHHAVPISTDPARSLGLPQKLQVWPAARDHAVHRRRCALTLESRILSLSKYRRVERARRRRNCGADRSRREGLGSRRRDVLRGHGESAERERKRDEEREGQPTGGRHFGDATRRAVLIAQASNHCRREEEEYHSSPALYKKRDNVDAETGASDALSWSCSFSSDPSTPRMTMTTSHLCFFDVPRLQPVRSEVTKAKKSGQDVIPHAPPHTPTTPTPSLVLQSPSNLSSLLAQSGGRSTSPVPAHVLRRLSPDRICTIYTLCGRYLARDPLGPRCVINMPVKFDLARVGRVEHALVLRPYALASRRTSFAWAQQWGQVQRLGPVSDGVVVEVMSVCVHCAAPRVGVVVTGMNADSSRVIIHHPGPAATSFHPAETPPFLDVAPRCRCRRSTSFGLSHLSGTYFTAGQKCLGRYDVSASQVLVNEAHR